MHFQWNIYVRFELEVMAESPVMSTSQGTYVRIEQTSEAIRVKVSAHWVRTFRMCFFRIYNPKNLSRIETLHTESDAY